ncbi:BatA domain-containing protein [Hymenobacter sp. BT664]|uniref:BatA domain-containing protein n=1 Tax=Hymenobacter montanus TaxID=2771359 RepID=A0A927GIR4_9BACT|nr:BatA domain-containing protein [Hymenobacter montanus]MBD2767723.1 BatA domain-containing protein [Hymenobacter montanus]
MLLTPSALLALLGLLVPVAIHLWNRRPGREVAVGSLRWLTAGANRRLRSLRPEQLPLLLLRAALLAVLAVALAGPAWRQAVPAGRGQALVSASLVGTRAFAMLQPALDSLRRRGYALRALAPEFPLVPPAAGLVDSLGQRTSARGARPPDSARESFTWARVRQATEVFPGQPLYVVTTAALREFQGSHPPLAGSITWRILPVETSATWLQSAASTGTDSLRLLLGRTRATQTTFRVVAVAKPRPGAIVRVAGLAPLRYEETRAGGAQLRLIPTATGSPTAASVVPVRTRALRAVIYASPSYAADARALHAALRAASIGLPVPLVLTQVASPPSANDQADWLFWLADSPLPAAWAASVRKELNVWQEASGPGIADTAHLLSPAAAEPPVTIWRRGQASPGTGWSPAGGNSFSLWTDGLGRAVLSRQGLGRGAYYRLHTRLSPPWSELADCPALPAQLLELLQPSPEWLGGNELSSVLSQDQRALDPTQLTPTRPLKSPGSAVAPATFRLTDLRPWAVLATGLLFAVERLLARRRVRQLSPATP